jgi:hypothetical protein
MFGKWSFDDAGAEPAEHLTKVRVGTVPDNESCGIRVRA